MLQRRWRRRLGLSGDWGMMYILGNVQASLCIILSTYIPGLNLEEGVSD